MTEPRLRASESRQVDERAVREYGMLGLVLMENAGRGCADWLEDLGIRGPVVICCGSGNNGGDGFVIARLLEARGYEVRVVLTGDPTRLRGDAAANWEILCRAGTPASFLHLDASRADIATLVSRADWIVDALVGTGATGPLRAPADWLVRIMNSSPARRFAIDLPSGLDCDTGVPAEPTVKADYTATMVAEKAGFSCPAARPYLGTVRVIEIGVPRRLLEDCGAICRVSRHSTT